MRETLAAGAAALWAISGFLFADAPGRHTPSTESDQSRAPLRLEERADAMGTTYTVVVYGVELPRMRTAVEAAFNEVRRIDRMLSNYRPDSEVSNINRHAAERAVEVSAEMMALLRECQRYSRESEGTFDITVGPLMRVWGFYRGTGRLASKQEVAEALEYVGSQHILLDTAKTSVRFARRGIELDFGGIGKGYAVDRMIAVLQQNGMTTALVNAGGSCIYGLGAPPSEARGWEVDIRSPRDPSKTASRVYLRDQSLSTSGSSEKSFYAEGRLYSHIMDPRTGFPAGGMLAISVMAPRTLDSEAWAKPYFILGREWAARHKAGDHRVLMCEEGADQECSWVP